MYSSGLLTFVTWPFSGLISSARPGGELTGAADRQLPTAVVERPRQLVGHFGRPRRIEAAVAPHDLHLGALALRREAVADAGAGRRGLLEERGRLGLDARGVAE